MAFLFISRWDNATAWREALLAEIPDLDFRIWPDGAGAPEEIEGVLVWQPEPGLLMRFPRLKAIFSLGAGVDHLLLKGGPLPKGVPIVKLVDRSLTLDMTHYVLHWVLHFHRDFPGYAQAQGEARWRRRRYPAAAERRIGILGAGTLGGESARALAGLGFDVACWSRTPKAIDRVVSFHGRDGLDSFLARSDILVCLLPLTPDTGGILSRRTFDRLPEGAYLINAGRGGHLVEADLLAALAANRIAGAALDVFRDEPLPRDHPFWSHPRVAVTPHIASDSTPATAAREIADNIRRLRSGRPLLHMVDPALHY